MQLVAVATWAILLPLHTLWVEALVLRGEVIAILTIAASENDFVAGHVKNLCRYSLHANRYAPSWRLAIGDQRLAVI